MTEQTTDLTVPERLVILWYSAERVYADEHDSVDDAVEAAAFMGDRGDGSPFEIEVWDRLGYRRIEQRGVDELTSLFRGRDAAATPEPLPFVAHVVITRDGYKPRIVLDSFRDLALAQAAHERLSKYLGDRVAVERVDG